MPIAKTFEPDEEGTWRIRDGTGRELYAEGRYADARAYATLLRNGRVEAKVVARRITVQHVERRKVLMKELQQLTAQRDVIQQALDDHSLLMDDEKVTDGG